MSTAIQCPKCNARLVIKDDSMVGKKIACPKCQNAFRITLPGGAGAAPSKPQVVTPQLVSPQFVKPQTVKPQSVKPQVASPQTAKPAVVKPSVVKPTLIKPVGHSAAQSAEPAWNSLDMQDDTGAVGHGDFDFSDVGQLHDPLAGHDPLAAPISPAAVVSPGASSAWTAPTREVVVTKPVDKEKQRAEQKQKEKMLSVVGAAIACGILVIMILGAAWFMAGSSMNQQDMAEAQEAGPMFQSAALMEAYNEITHIPSMPGGNNVQSRGGELLAIYPQMFEATEKQNKLLARNKRIRDIKRVEGFQATAVRHWLTLDEMPDFDPDNQAHREMKARIVACLLRESVGNTDLDQPPSKEKWQAFVLAEQAMFENEALTKRAIKDTDPQLLKQVVENMELWAPKFGTEMPKRSANKTAGAGSPAEPGKANLPTLFGFNAAKRALMVDYLKEQGNSTAKARLTMGMVTAALGNAADELDIERSEAFPDKWLALREAIETRSISREYLQGPKIPVVFSKLIADYQNEKLKPEEEDLAMYVIIAFLATEM